MWHKTLILSLIVLFAYITSSISADEIKNENENENESESATEYALKVAYLYNFVKFTEWPEYAFEGSESKFRLCAIGAQGKNPLSAQLAELETKTAKQRAISIINLDEVSVEEVKSRQCHLIYIDGRYKDLDSLTGQLEGSPVLLVGDRENFVTNGGMIGLKLVKKKIRFEVNLETANKNDIAISALLLKLAINVYGA